jgi:hypothetical protein
MNNELEPSAGFIVAQSRKYIFLRAAELPKVRASSLNWSEFALINALELESSKAGGVSPRSQCGAKYQFEQRISIWTKSISAQKASSRTLSENF